MQNLTLLWPYWVSVSYDGINLFAAIATVFLAWKTLQLTIKDKSKTIAINELKNQSVELKNQTNELNSQTLKLDVQNQELKALYLLQIQPRLKVQIIGNGYFVENFGGGDCHNLKIEPYNCEESTNPDPFDGWNDLASHNPKIIPINKLSNCKYAFKFEDHFNNKYKQILLTQTMGDRTYPLEFTTVKPG